MKKIIGLVVILAVLVLGSYYGTGMITERKVRETINIINQSNGLYAEIKNYDRGWFSSSAQIDWNMMVPERVVSGADGQSKTIPAQKYELTMPLKINHGPVIFYDSGVKFGLGYAKTDIDLPPKYVKQFESLFTKESTKPQVDLSLFVNYLAKTRITLSIPEFQLIAKEGSGKLNWQGMNTSISMNSDLSAVDGDLKISGMTYSQNEMKMTLAAVDSVYSLSKSSYGLFTGSASLSFPSLVVMNKDAKIFELDDFDVESSSDISGEVVNSHLRMSLDSLLLNNQKYGPGNFEMAIRNLDAKAMGRINELSNQLQNGDEAQKQQTLVLLMQELPKLVSQGPEIEVSQMEFKLPDGKIEGNMLLSIPKQPDANIMTIVQGVKGNAHLEVPRDLVRMAIADTIKKSIMNNQLQQALAQQNQNPMSVTEVHNQAQSMADKRLDAMIDAGVFVKKDKDLVVDLQLEKGKLIINGKPFDANMIKF